MKQKYARILQSVPDNVFLLIQVCDFGLARNMTLGTKMLMSIKGTPLYMAPEVLDATKGYGYEADLWSLGCVIYECLAGEPPFSARSIMHLAQLIKYSDVKWPSFLSSACIDFLKRLLVKDPKSRMKWKQILSHKFVEKGIHIVSGDKESEFTNPIEYQQEIEKTQQAETIQRISKIKQFETGEDFRSSRESLKVNLNIQSEVEETDVEDAFVVKSELESSENNEEVVPFAALAIQPHSNLQHFQLEQPRTHNISNFKPLAENPNMVMHRFMDNVDPELANLMMMPPAMFQPIFQPVHSVQNLENFSYRVEKSVEGGNTNLTKAQSDGISTDASSVPVETEEWVQFLLKSMQEIFDGDLEIYKQENMMTLIVGLLRESKFGSKIVDHVVQIISLPYAIDMPQSILDDIDQLYLRTKVLPNLIYRSKLLCVRKFPENSTDLMSIPKVDKLIHFCDSELKTLSSIYDLVVFLVYSGENFLDMLCDTIALMNLDHVFRSFILSGTNGDSEDGARLAGSIIALINAILQGLPENSKMVEKIIFHEDIELFKLLSNKDTKSRLRACHMLRLLGRFCCLALRKQWQPNMYSRLKELMTDTDQRVRDEAENIVEEFKECVSWFKAENLQQTFD